MSSKSSSQNITNTTYTFKLTKKAKNVGGDRYECPDIENFNIYIPQEISRKSNDEPKKNIMITIESLK